MNAARKSFVARFPGESAEIATSSNLTARRRATQRLPVRDRANLEQAEPPPDGAVQDSRTAVVHRADLLAINPDRRDVGDFDGQRDVGKRARSPVPDPQAQPMSEPCFPRRIVVRFGLIVCTTAASAPASRAQFLKPDKKTAPAPEFREVTQWINSEPLTMAKLRGKVVLVHFWTNGCDNCVNNYPHYKAWAGSLRGKDVVIIGESSQYARDPGERDVARIKARGRATWFAVPDRPPGTTSRTGMPGTTALQVRHQSAVTSTITVLPPLTSFESVPRERLPGDAVPIVTGRPPPRRRDQPRAASFRLAAAFDPRPSRLPSPADRVRPGCFMPQGNLFFEGPNWTRY